MFFCRITLWDYRHSISFWIWLFSTAAFMTWIHLWLWLRYVSWVQDCFRQGVEICQVMNNTKYIWSAYFSQFMIFKSQGYPTAVLTLPLAWETRLKEKFCWTGHHNPGTNKVSFPLHVMTGHATATSWCHRSISTHQMKFEWLTISGLWRKWKKLEIFSGVVNQYFFIMDHPAFRQCAEKRRGKHVLFCEWMKEKIQIRHIRSKLSNKNARHSTPESRNTSCPVGHLHQLRQTFA